MRERPAVVDITLAPAVGTVWLSEPVNGAIQGTVTFAAEEGSEPNTAIEGTGVFGGFIDTTDADRKVVDTAELAADVNLPFGHKIDAGGVFDGRIGSWGPGRIWFKLELEGDPVVAVSSGPRSATCVFSFLDGSGGLKDVTSAKVELVSKGRTHSELHGRATGDVSGWAISLDDRGTS